MKNHILLSLFCLIIFAGCKKDTIETAPPEAKFAENIVGRWKFSSYTSKTNYPDGTFTDNGSEALNAASSITFRADGTATVINFGVSQTDATYKIVSNNEFTFSTPSAISNCMVQPSTNAGAFVFTGRVNNPDGSVDYTTYFLSDHMAL